MVYDGLWMVVIMHSKHVKTRNQVFLEITVFFLATQKKEGKRIYRYIYIYEAQYCCEDAHVCPLPRYLLTYPFDPPGAALGAKVESSRLEIF